MAPVSNPDKDMDAADGGELSRRVSCFVFADFRGLAQVEARLAHTLATTTSEFRPSILRVC